MRKFTYGATFLQTSNKVSIHTNPIVYLKAQSQARFVYPFNLSLNLSNITSMLNVLI